MLNAADYILADLNPPQREAVTWGDGPLLIFAGAGSGKTRVLTHRIAYLLQERRAAPEQVLAVTFTNKAANEMKGRIGRLVGWGARHMWVGTFHSICARMLRRDGEKIGIADNFVIFDTDDQTTVIADAMQELQIDGTRWKPGFFLGRISSAKNELISPTAYAETAKGFDQKLTSDVYLRYQANLRKNNALDFDDLIMSTVELLRKETEVLEEYRQRFRYVFVDEYQDINLAQYRLIGLLAAGSRNLCVVGDDDQSIYTWRGANSKLLLQFNKDYADAHVVKLEQNYRSPQSFLDAAWYVIRENETREEKRLWTEREGGPAIRCFRGGDEHSEAAFIARTIRELVENQGLNYRDAAVLYRMNAQSRVLEQMMLSQGIPYRVVGGLKFFNRKEVKDIVAYLRVIYNPLDSVSLRRIINTPTRGIGAATISKLEELAAERNLSLYEMLGWVEEAGLGPRARNAIHGFNEIIRSLRELAQTATITELTEAVIKQSGYEAALLEEGTVQARTRLENITELLSATQELEKQAEDEESKSLRAFLENAALLTDADAARDDDNSVTLMTLHAAKGLEFPAVFISGLEEGVFPLLRAITGQPTELEEERRLCYVGLTRAMEHLYCTMADSRTIFGASRYDNKPSQFLRSIPEHLLEPADGGMPGSSTKDLTWEKADIRISPAAQVILARAKSDDAVGFRAGDRVRHNTFGEGMVLAIQGSGDQAKVTVNFKRPGIGVKTIVLAFAPLEKM